MDDISDEELLASVKDLGLDKAPVDCNSPVYTEDVYQPWNSEGTRVISGPLGEAKFPGTRYPTWRDAQHTVGQKYCVMKFWTTGPRWMARIKK